MEIGLDLKNFKSFEDGHDTISISMLFSLLGYILDVIIAIDHILWTVTKRVKRRKNLKQHS